MRSVDGAIGAETVPRRRLDARVRKTRGATLVAGPRDALELDETAAFVWRNIDESRTVRDIADVLAGEYDVDPDTALRDVTELIADLVECQVVEVTPPAG